MIANVKIEQDKENKHIHRVFVNGEKLKRVNHIDLNIDVAEAPQVNVGIVGGCDFEGMADVHFDYSPYTVKEACKILREEIMKRNDLFDGFVSSIQTAIEEAPNYIKNRELAERILKRIIGEDRH